MTIRLMIIDDHELIRAGLIQYFGRQPGIAVVAEASNGDELLEKLKTISVDILLLDLNMPGISGTELIAMIKNLYPGLYILILSAHYEIQMVLSALKAGASGYICKNSSPKTLSDAVNEVMVMGKYLSRDMDEKLAYACISTPSDEIKDQNGEIRLNGKTIREWKEDCLTFYQEKICQKNIIDLLNSRNTELENEIFDLKEEKRHMWKLQSLD